MEAKPKFVEVKAIIKPFKLDDVREAVVALGVPGMTVIGGEMTDDVVRGVGLQREDGVHYYGRPEGSEHAGVPYMQRVFVYVVVPEDLGDRVEQAILDAAKTGLGGDGIVYKTPAHDAKIITDGKDFVL